ncbi:hypothetical protein [Aureibacter tunicatorum]|uniref:Uncharacterized protein n=1 Tax=Aureibacter tunicatorum TaxID=866807 RepID=A0AAE4BVF7_9BACT|nr:hypothetical protein [Aureibacter tunicatorum]MDR6242050.1 hypothetical protein [Aureibacter tunicatorum]BDD03625.1 hypothetical protein AUTU_11080 [Aureibacter tunicatorum]
MIIHLKNKESKQSQTIQKSNQSSTPNTTQPIQCVKFEVSAREWYANAADPRFQDRFLRTSIRNSFLLPFTRHYPHLTVDVDFASYDPKKETVTLEVTKMHYSASKIAPRYIFHEDKDKGIFRPESIHPEGVMIIRTINKWIKSANIPELLVGGPKIPQGMSEQEAVRYFGLESAELPFENGEFIIEAKKKKKKKTPEAGFTPLAPLEEPMPTPTSTTTNTTTVELEEPKAEAAPSRRKKKKHKKKKADGETAISEFEETPFIPELTSLTLESPAPEPPFELVPVKSEKKTESKQDVLSEEVIAKPTPFTPLEVEEIPEMEEALADASPITAEAGVETKTAKKKKKKKKHHATQAEGVIHANPEMLEEHIKFADFKKDLGVESIEGLPEEVRTRLFAIQKQFDQHILRNVFGPSTDRNTQEFGIWFSKLKHLEASLKSRRLTKLTLKTVDETFERAKAQRVSRIHEYDLSQIVPPKFVINFADAREQAVFQLVLKFSYGILALRLKEELAIEIMRYISPLCNFGGLINPNRFVNMMFQRIHHEAKTAWEKVPDSSKLNAGEGSFIGFHYSTMDSDFWAREKLWDSVIPEMKNYHDTALDLIYFCQRILSGTKLPLFNRFIERQTKGKAAFETWTLRQFKELLSRYRSTGEGESEGATAR